MTHQEHCGCSLNKPEVRAVLERLHMRAKYDIRGLFKEYVLFATDKLLRRSLSVEKLAWRMRDAYLSIVPEQGVFLYLVARSIQAKRIVEFGTSFGVSTIYLAAALQDNGGGLVISSEIEERKVIKARENLQEAGLGDLADIRLGDAKQTLSDPGETVDMVFLDGWKTLYLPVIKMLKPHLRPDAVVLADEINQFKLRKTLVPYVAYMQDPKNGFQTTTLPIHDGLEYSVRLGKH